MILLGYARLIREYILTAHLQNRVFNGFPCRPSIIRCCRFYGIAVKSAFYNRNVILNARADMVDEYRRFICANGVFEFAIHYGNVNIVIAITVNFNAVTDSGVKFATAEHNVFATVC